MTRVLVACEFTGVVRDALRRRGVTAFSCDLRSSSGLEFNHLRCDVMEILSLGWDAMICFPPCTYLCSTQNRWMSRPGRKKMQDRAVTFARTLLESPIQRIALENPVGVLSSKIRKPDQIIQPWQFGHGEVKATCLWLKGLPLLKPTKIVDGRKPVSWLETGTAATKSAKRSMTYPGIAKAMAEQWFP